MGEAEGEGADEAAEAAMIDDILSSAPECGACAMIMGMDEDHGRRAGHKNGKPDPMMKCLNEEAKTAWMAHMAEEGGSGHDGHDHDGSGSGDDHNGHDHDGSGSADDHDGHDHDGSGSADDHDG